MNLPSFLWLWKIAAWSMGLSIAGYSILAITGGWMMWKRRTKTARPRWLRPLHLTIGTLLVILILVLLSIGLVGTLGYYGNLGHSVHLPAGLVVVALTLLSAWSAAQIGKWDKARSLHVTLNALLLVSFCAVSWSGWTVVQKYLP